MTVFHTRTTTVLTTPMCLDRDDLLDDCTDRKKRLNDEEEFILVDGKKFTPTEVEKLLSTVKPNFEDFDEERRQTAMSLASLTSSIDEAFAINPSVFGDRTARLVRGTYLHEVLVPTFAPLDRPTVTVAVRGGCAPARLNSLAPCSDV